MKNLCLLLSAVILMAGCASVPVSETAPLQKVLEVENTTQAKLFAKSQLWASKTFVSAKDAIELTNSEAGLITIRTSFQSYSYTVGMAMGGIYYIVYKVVLEIKDNKVRITCDNPIYQAIYRGNTQQMSKPTAAMVNEYIDKANAIIASYEAAIKAPDTDW